VTTRIIMSFAMAEGGMMFVQWLRNRLMQHYGLFSTNSVYVDFVSARAGDAYYGVTPEAPLPHYATVKADLREHMRSATQAIPIGAMHPDWKEMFTKAMNEADVVLFILTKAFMASQWCLQELDGFKLVLEKRPGVKGIILDLEGIGFDPAQKGLPTANITLVQAGKELSQGGILWDRGLWKISDRDFDSLIRAIGEHGEWREG